MIDICYVGNSSIDIINNKNVTKKVFGGSAIYSALASRCITKKSIAIISNVNDELKLLLNNFDIQLIGNVLPEITMFNINEEKGTCDFIKKCKKNISINKSIAIDNLHISFRKGVDIDSIINNPNVKFNNLSVDVMVHSINDFIPYLIKYNDRISTLFCNLKEFKLIRSIVQNIPKIIITNEDKPIILINNADNYFYKIKPIEKVISSTGAGDSFIGGYIGAYSDGKNINECIKTGIKTSYNSLNCFGPVKSICNDNFLIEPLKLPNNIVVIGNSCSGKTTFVDFFKQYFDIYADIDDLKPLLEMFMIDDVSRNNDIIKLKEIETKIKYMKEIYNIYIKKFPNIEHYSIKEGEGHDIIEPILWDIILRKAVMIDKEKNNIIQFSRGKDAKYEKELGNDVYSRSLLEIINSLENKKDLIIINLTSDLDIRKKRNYIRFENGGHFVSDNTMDNIYNQDIFNYKQIDENRGYITLDNNDYPVYTINNNKMLSSVELNQFLMYNMIEIVKYFNNNGGNKK